MPHGWETSSSAAVARRSAAPFTVRQEGLGTDEQDTSRFDDLLEPLRSLGWAADIEDDEALHLRHPLHDMVISAIPTAHRLRHAPRPEEPL